MVDEYRFQPGADGSGTYQTMDGMKFRRREPDTDVDAVFGRYITITLLQFDLTHHVQLDDWGRHLGDFGDRVMG